MDPHLTPEEVKANFSALFSKVLELRGCGRTPIETIKEIREIGGISLGQAKQIYCAAADNKSLAKHEEEIFAELLPVLDNLDGVTIQESSAAALNTGQEETGS